MSIGVNAQLDRSKQPKPGPAPKISIEVPGEFELKNGLKVLVVENNKLPRVSYSLTIDNKPIREGKKAGIKSILGSMLGNGTTSIPKDEFNEEVDFLGANINFGSQSAFARSLSKYSDRILELMADAAINPLLTEEEFNKQKDQLLEGLKVNEKSVATIASRVGTALSYGANHPSGEFTTEETVNNITFGDVVAFYEKHFNPNNAYLVVVGDIDFKTIKKQIEKHFAEWQKSVDVSTSIPEVNPNAQYTQINFVDMPNAVQSDIRVTNNVDLKMKDADYQAALITNFILGGGSSGYLYENLRETHGYTYGAYSGIGASRYGASRFSATAQVRNEVTDSSVVEMLKEIKRIKTETVDPEALKLAKAKYVGNFVMGLENPQTVANYALNIKLNDLPKNFYTTYLQKINAVTADDVKRVANKYFKTENARVIVVGKGSEVIENLEKTGLPIKYYDTYANAVDKPVYEIKMDPDMDATKVMQAYIDAIGGSETLNKVNSVYMTAEAELQPGMMMNLEMKKTVKNQYLQIVNTPMGSQKQVLDGASGYTSAAGQKTDMTEDQIKAVQEESSPFPEVNYLNGGVTLEKIEMVDGVKAYKINVDETTSIYYSVDTGLKIKQVKTSEAGSQTTFYDNYKEVAGVKFPFTIGQTFGPRRFDFIVKEIKVNEGVSDADFD